MSTTSPVEFILEPQSDDFDADDSRWMQQVNDLCRSVESEVGGIRRDVTPVDGAKGGVETLILALGSAGAITAAVEVFKAWLARSRDRALTISTEIDGRTQKISVAGTGMKDEDIRRFMEEALRRASA